jgi:hypothetical protein
MRSITRFCWPLRTDRHSHHGPFNREEHVVAMFKRGCVILLLISVSACGRPAPTTPTPNPTPAPPRIGTFHLTGIATDDDGRPVTGATVTLDLNPSGCGEPDFVSGGVTDGAGVYHIDFDAPGAAGFIIALLDAGSPGHEGYAASISAPASDGQNLLQNLHLYRIKRITAGESTVVTVVPGDTRCGPYRDLTCRTVRVVVPTDGLLTMSCDPQGDGYGGPGLTIAGYNGRGETGLPWHVIAGEYAVDIGMWSASTVSQSCVFKTSLAP